MKNWKTENYQKVKKIEKPKTTKKFQKNEIFSKIGRISKNEKLKDRKHSKKIAKRSEKPKN